MKTKFLCWLGGFHRLGLFACLLLPLLLTAPKAEGSCLVDTVSGSMAEYYANWTVQPGCLCDAHVWGEYGPTTSYGSIMPLADVTWPFPSAPVSKSGNLYLYPIQAPYPDTFTRLWHWRMGVSNCQGTTYTADQLFLTLGNPTLVDQPQSQTVAVGGSATFNVSVLTADFIQPVIFQWLTNGVPIPGSTVTNNNANSSFGFANTASYTVTNIGPELNGVTFSVQAANHYLGGSPWQQSAGAVLTVNVPQPPVMQAKLSGSNVVLSWPASAAGFGLETRVGVTPGAWTSAGGTVVTNGSTVSVALPASDAMRLFRLRHP